MNPLITVVGIGEDGWEGLGLDARSALSTATLIVGSQRQLDLLPALDAATELLPSPLLGGLDELLARNSAIVFLASGDPMRHGLGTTIAQRVALDRLRVIPAVSSIALACARLAWSATDVTVLTTVTTPTRTILADLQPGRRILVLCRDGRSPADIASDLAEHGWGSSRVTMLERLGGTNERIVGPIVARDVAERFDDLCIVAVEPEPDAGTAIHSRQPGLPESAYETDGQITRPELRTLAIAALLPLPGQLLWDVGAGSGSVGIEWLRLAEGTRAIAVERDAERAARIGRNAAALGVPGLQVVTGEAPAVLTELADPDAIFLGGGLTTPDLLDTVWSRLRPGGRIVAHSVTVESEAVIHLWRARVGGTVARIALSQLDALGSFTTWRPALPIVQWQATKP